MKYLTKSLLFGVAVGDALGVPVEFRPRTYLDENPVTTMTGFGTYDQPPGTWSDDSSLTFCLAESLTQGYDLVDIAQKFVNWRFNNYWTAHNHLFDIGMTTSKSIDTLKVLVKDKNLKQLKLQRYYFNEGSNGNGSLMRILPLVLELKDKSIFERFELIWTVSALTHGHIRSALSCLIYLEFADILIQGEKDKRVAYQKLQFRIRDFLGVYEISERETQYFERLINEDITKLEQKEIRSSGYVIHALEASFWCFLSEDNYASCVLKAVNLGEDTDTTAAIAGGLAGIFYGYDSIPAEWVEGIARRADIEGLAERLGRRYSS